MKVVVIGGTGLIGSKLVKRLSERGHEVLPASPATGVDTLTGKGLAEALTGAQVVVDVSNSPSFEDTAVMRFFDTSTRNLLVEEAAAGVQHHVALSVVGTDRLQESGYFRAKLAQESRIKASGIPYTIVRATQFFEFMGRIADGSDHDGVIHVPAAAMQPIAADDVAAALADYVLGMPQNGVVEVAGPEAWRMDEAVRQYLDANQDTRQVISDSSARYFGVALNDRSLTPDDSARLTPTRFEDWLSPVAPH